MSRFLRNQVLFILCLASLCFFAFRSSKFETTLKLQASTDQFIEDHLQCGSDSRLTDKDIKKIIDKTKAIIGCVDVVVLSRDIGGGNQYLYSEARVRTSKFKMISIYFRCTKENYEVIDISLDPFAQS